MFDVFVGTDLRILCGHFVYQHFWTVKKLPFHCNTVQILAFLNDLLDKLVDWLGAFLAIS